MSTFYTSLNIIGVSVFTLFCRFPDWEGNNVNQRKPLLRELVPCSIKPYFLERNTSTIHKDVDFRINSILRESRLPKDSSLSPSTTTTTIATFQIDEASRSRCTVYYDEVFNYANKQKTNRISTKCCECEIYLCEVNNSVRIMCEVSSENSDMSDCLKHK